MKTCVSSPQLKCASGTVRKWFQVKLQTSWIQSFLKFSSHVLELFDYRAILTFHDNSSVTRINGHSFMCERQKSSAPVVITGTNRRTVAQMWLGWTMDRWVNGTLYFWERSYELQGMYQSIYHDIHRHCLKISLLRCCVCDQHTLCRSVPVTGFHQVKWLWIINCSYILCGVSRKRRPQGFFCMQLIL